MMELSLGNTILIVGVILGFIITFFIYKWDVNSHLDGLQSLVETLRSILADREKTINDLHLKLMAKDLNDYKLNTQITQPTSDFVQTEPTDTPIEQVGMDDFLKAIKEAPEEPVSQE